MNYASNLDVAAFMGIDASTLPSNVDTLISRANEFIDYITMDNIDSTVQSNLDAAKNAVCAQAEYMINVGDFVEYVGSGNAKLGNFSTSGGYGSLAPRARRFLLREGLLFRGVGMR